MQSTCICGKIIHYVVDCAHVQLRSLRSTYDVLHMIEFAKLSLHTLRAVQGVHASGESGN